MSLSTKILLFLAAFILLDLLCFVVYKEIESSKNQKVIQDSLVTQKQLIDGITRGLSQYTTKDDLDKFISNNGINLKAIKDDLDKLHADITSANVVTVDSNGTNATNLPSNSTVVTVPATQVPTVNCNGQALPCPDTFGYLKNTQVLQLNENFSSIKIPFGTVGFSASRKNPWSLITFPRAYNAVSVISTDENKKQYVYNKFTINVQNKEYDVNINSSVLKQQVPDSKFKWWNPRLFLGMDFGYNITGNRTEFTPSINLGIMSLGRYVKEPDLSFVQVGLGYETTREKAKVIVTPVMYNIGGHVPLIDNLFVGPSVHLGFTGDVSLMAGIRIGL
jgi:hypothetical protein